MGARTTTTYVLGGFPYDDERERARRAMEPAPASPLADPALAAGLAILAAEAAREWWEDLWD